MYKYFILFMAEEYSIVWIYHILLIHSSVDEYLGCFYLLAIMNNATINICVQISVWTYVFLRIYPRVELLGHMVTMLNHLRNCQPVFQSGCTMLHYHQQYMRVPFLQILVNTCYLTFFLSEV